MKSHILRTKFLEYFKTRKHKIVESDSLVPRNDPTVLFTPAGMNQFKKEFMGFDSGFSRAATAQRCLRTDDLDKVGKTRGHHTFFEMLGNFSFGDYFKKEAISFAWEFITKELRIPKNRLWVSVYKDDEEAYGIWLKDIGISENRIVRLGDKDNFWPAEAKEKGPNGPCGPCSEVFFDQGEKTGCEMPQCDPSCSCGRFLEIWNLVFTQFNRLEGGKLEPLPNKNIDTGMGLERLAAIMQGVPTNFDTDLFQPLIREIMAKSTDPSLTQAREYTCAVADHIRAITFAIFDGVLPANDGRGYVVRKLIRKSALNLKSLGIKKPFLHTLVPVLADIMEPQYPDLKDRRENIAEVILAEEKNFHIILNASDTLLQEKFGRFIENPDPQETGRVAFLVYDTYGLPLDLTQDWLKKNKITMSEEAYQVELIAQKTRSKLQSNMKGDVFSGDEFDYGASSTKFLGYGRDITETEAKIVSIITEHYARKEEAKKISFGEEALIILDKTVFYPEGGGQIGDTGEIVKGKSVFQVEETLKVGTLILHKGRVSAGSFKKNDTVKARIEERRRLAIARNHTATHMLQAVLRKVLGPHIRQQGSLVTEEKLRFDFTHFKDVTDEQLERIEEIVNEHILRNDPLVKKQMGLAEAKKAGALAFFGEKYDAKVRVVSIGGLSRELCGGTHLESTGQIGLFKIIQEGSIASGVRRIEAVTGTGAFALVKAREKTLQECAGILNVAQDNVPGEIRKCLERAKELEKAANAQRIQDIGASIDGYISAAVEISGVKFIRQTVKNADMDSLRRIVDSIKQKSASMTFVALGADREGKALLVVGITGDLVNKGFKASDYVSKSSLAAIGGGGGGRPDFAQAGGTNPGGFETLFDNFQESIRAQVTVT